MVGIRNVISTLSADGREVMGPNVLLYHHPESAIVSGSLLTVESNHFCVLKSRGAVLNVYETGRADPRESVSTRRSVGNSRTHTRDAPESAGARGAHPRTQCAAHRERQKR